MKTLGRVGLALAVVGAVAVLTSCKSSYPPPQPLIQQGWVPEDKVYEGLGRMMRAPMPVYYAMPLDAALAILGEPSGRLRDTTILRRFARTERAGAYYWLARSTTVYLVYDRHKVVQNLIVVDNDTNVGAEMLLTREEILSMRVKPGMQASRVFEIMGMPDRIEHTRVAEGRPVDRYLYESADDVAPAVIVEVDRDTLEVIFVSTAPKEQLGPPPDFD